jgi:hypothetical protein
MHLARLRLVGPCLGRWAREEVEIGDHHQRVGVGAKDLQVPNRRAQIFSSSLGFQLTFQTVMFATLLESAIASIRKI